MFTFTVLAVVLVTALYWYKRRITKLSLFSDNGIPTPKPNLIYGNMREYASLGTIDFHKKLIQEHGPIVGYYLGIAPYLVIADKTLLHEILVSKSNLFLTRPRRIPGGVNPDPKRKKMLAHLPPDIWQKVRKALSGMFNPVRLKPLIPNLRKSIEHRFIECIEEGKAKSSGELELGTIFECLSIELIGQTAFGRKVAVQGNPNDEMLAALRDKYDHAILAPLNILNLCFPELNFVVGKMRIVWQKTKELLGFGAGNLNTTLWQVAENCVKDSLNPAANPDGHYSQFQLLQKAGIPEEFMVAYSVNAFQGDYENVSTTLTFLTHLLMDHPDIQDRIREEALEARQNFKIDLDIKNENSPSSETVYEYYTSLKYMESVIYEMLRLWPQTSFVRRSPAQDYEYINEEGRRFVIPKGVHIQASHHAVQRDEEVWGEDSEEFKPERFLTGGDKDKVSPNCVTYQGFGSGARHCMGQRFATLILKMIVTTMLDKYQIERSEKSGDIQEHHRTLMNPTSTFYAKLINR